MRKTPATEIFSQVSWPLSWHFSRASGAIDDARRFLQKVATKNPPGELRPESIEIETFGNRAIVMCVITQGGKDYQNIRLFVRIDANWKLLAWANEQVG